MMDAVKIGTLPTTKPLLSNKIYESTDSTKEKIDDISFAEDNEDEEMRLRLSDEEENEQENISSNVQNHLANSQLKKDDLELNTPTTVNSEKTSEVSEQESESTDTSAEQVETPAPVNSEETSEVNQEELKESETSVKEVETPVSVNAEETPETDQSELKNSDATEDATAEQVDNSDSAKPEEASEDQEQESKDSDASDEQEYYSDNGDLDEEFVTENGSVSDEESQMGDRMSHNPGKYWSGFNPRPWKGGQRKRATFPHRGSKSWYHQQYPDRDKLKKNNLHHSTSHFIRTSRSRANFGSSSRESWSARSSGTSDSLRLKDKKSSKDIGSGKDQLIKQNGVANGLDHKENNSSSQNDKLINVMNKGDKVGMKNKELISTVQSKRTLDPKLSSDKNVKLSDDGVKLLNGISASLNKTCELSSTDFDKGKSSSQSTVTDSMKNPKISEVLSEAQIQIKDVTSQNSGIDLYNDSMDVDESINDKPDSTSDLICIQTNIRDSSEKTGRNDDISCITIVQEKSNGLDKQSLENGQASPVKNYQSVSADVDTESSQMLNNDDDWRDSESGSLVIDESIQAKDNKSGDKDNAEATDGGKASKEVEKSSAAKSKDQNGLNNVIEEVDLIDDDSQEATLRSSNVDANASLSVPIDAMTGDKVEESSQDGRAAVHKRRRRKRLAETMQEELLASESENGGRQKRRSARNAEEMIRRESQKDADEENSEDDTDKMVRVNYRKSSVPNIITRTLSPPTLKRTLDDVADEKDSVATSALKRIRPNMEDAAMEPKDEKKEVLDPVKFKESVAATGQLMRKLSQEDIRGKLRKLTQEELETMIIQKVVECMTVRSEMGKLRDQARAAKKSQESLRTKCQQLQKQVEGFEMVLKRINYDKNSNGDKYVPPIKINRSVGLQVSFLSQETGIQSLKQIQANRAGANGANNSKPASTTMMSQDNLSPRKMMKTRSPRRPEMPPSAMVQIPTGSTVAVQSNGSNSALVMTAKSADPNAKRNASVLQIVAPAGNQPQNATNRPTLTIQRTTSSTPARGNDLIDLTDEEDKSKVSTVVPITTAGAPARLSRVLHTVPGVTLGGATNLRILPAANSQGAMGGNVPRLAYVMQSGPNGVPTRQIVLTSNNSVKTVTSITTSGINYKRGVATLPNGTVRLVTTQAPTVQIAKHPAPLPETLVTTQSDPSWKLAPPAPSLKISKVATGIVLSWNMSVTDKYADIVSYQLYAYQEVAGTAPSATLWKKVGDVRALPLPMACTLTQFTEGNNYYFAVRAVDTHSRFGQYSKPGNISL